MIALRPLAAGDEAAFAELAAEASRPYADFVYDADSAARTRARALGEAAPPFAHLARGDDGRAIAAVACGLGADISRARLRAAFALRRDAVLSADETRRIALAGATLLRLADDDFYLARVAVAPHARGAGVGRDALAWFEAAARAAHARRLALEVSPDAVAAVALYSAAGFTVAGTHRAADGARELRYQHMIKAL